MKKLIRGIVAFRKDRPPGYREAFAKLALGQSPDTLLVSCSDSRVAPNVFASTEPGDLFVIRNVGNLIAPCGEEGSEAAAIEFSTLALDVTDIIVCGHSDCGAIRALMDGGKPLAAPHLKAWLRHAGEALRRFRAGGRMKADLPDESHVSQLNALLQLEHLRTYPSVRERVEAGRLRLHAWWFDIARAEVSAWEEAAKRFVVIDEEEAARLLERLD